MLKFEISTCCASRGEVQVQQQGAQRTTRSEEAGGFHGSLLPLSARFRLSACFASELFIVSVTGVLHVHTTREYVKALTPAGRDIGTCTYSTAVRSVLVLLKLVQNIKMSISNVVGWSWLTDRYRNHSSSLLRSPCQGPGIRFIPPKGGGTFPVTGHSREFPQEPVARRTTFSLHLSPNTRDH